MGTRASKISHVAVALEQKRVDEIIKEDRRVMLDSTATKLGIGHNAVQEMIGSLGYRKICARVLGCNMETLSLKLERTASRETYEGASFNKIL
jgi:hypothetical protein